MEEKTKRKQRKAIVKKPKRDPRKELTKKFERPKKEVKAINKPKKELVNPFIEKKQPKMMKGGKIAMSYNKGGLIQQD